MRRPAFLGFLTLERLLPIACLAGALLLIGSEFMETFRLQGAGDTVFDVSHGNERHSWAMLVLGVAAVVAVVVAVGAGSKPAAMTIAVSGLAALLLFLLIDLPDAGKVGTFDDAEIAFQQAEAQPESGFWIVLIASLVLAICGAAMATLSRDQLRALRPGAKPLPKDREKPTAPWSRRKEETVSAKTTKRA